MSPAKQKALALREEYIKIQKANDEASQALWKNSGEAATRMHDAIREHIREDKLLNLATWTLSIRNRSDAYLIAKEDSRELKELSELTETDYHCRFVLVYGPPREEDDYREELVTLRFDDGDVTLIFDDSDLINPFIKEYGITVDTSGVDEEIANHQKIVDTLTELKKLVQ